MSAEQPVEQSINWLQIQLFGPYFSSFSTNSYGYYSQTSQNLTSNIQTFASALIVRQVASDKKSGSAHKQQSHKQKPFRVIPQNRAKGMTGQIIVDRQACR